MAARHGEGGEWVGAVNVPASPTLGPDGLWRVLVTVDGQPAVQVVDPPTLENSAKWARSALELTALADLMRSDIT